MSRRGREHSDWTHRVQAGFAVQKMKARSASKDVWPKILRFAENPGVHEKKKPAMLSPASSDPSR
jgi:hypothetical protein